MYDNLIRDVNNIFLQGNSRYTNDLNAAYSIILHLKSDPRDLISDADKSEGLSFTQVDQDEQGTSHIIYYYCKKSGHYKHEFPKLAAKADKE